MPTYNLNSTSYANMVADLDGVMHIASKLPSVIYEDAHYPVVPDNIPQNMQRYVGGAGADNFNDGTQGNPWATFNYALQQMAESGAGGFYCLNISGDIVVDAFIDTKPYGSGNGSLNQFMIIRSDPSLQSVPTFTLNARVEIDGQQFWNWDSLKMRGAHGVNLGEDLPTTHHTWRNIDGIASGLGGDNHGFIQGLNSNASYLGVFNSDLYGAGSASDGVHGNTSCLICFGLTHLRWMNNHVRNAPRPLYFKHGNQDSGGAAEIVIENNYVSGTVGECAFAGRKVGGVAIIKNNIFEASVALENGGGGPQVQGYDVENNYFMSFFKVGHTNDPVVDCNIRNNYFAESLLMLQYADAGAPDNTNFTDFNQHATDLIINKRTNYTLAEWAANGLPSNQSANGVVGAAVFAGGDTFNAIEDYEMIGGNGIAAGSNGKNIGVNVLKVGVK